MSSRLVYSTAGDNTCPECGRPPGKCRCRKQHATPPPDDGIVRIRRERKGRGGKEVTVISGLPLASHELKALAKQLKIACGCGGSVNDRNIEIQGDQRQQVKTRLEQAGHKVKLSGG